MQETNLVISESLSDYLAGRWKDQCEYFESKARINQKRFMRSRIVALVCGWLTPIAIFILVLIPPRWRDLYNLIPLVLSTLAVGSYQWEELHN